jgi:hypothetical protein
MTKYQGDRTSFRFRQISIQLRHLAYFQINIANSTYPMYTCVCYQKHTSEVHNVICLAFSSSSFIIPLTYSMTYSCMKAKLSLSTFLTGNFLFI